LIGEHDGRAGAVIADVLRFVNAPLIRIPIGEALMAKYAANAYHALKIGFANEIGLMCGQEGLDASLVMETLCRDNKLNISARYLHPGFAFGGSCLPKDVRALAYRSHEQNIDTPLLSSIL